MLATAQPKPTPRDKAKAALARLQAKHDRKVYAEVTVRDGGVCRVTGEAWDIHRHHLCGRRYTTTADVCLVTGRIHAELHPKVGGKTLRLHGNANDALTLERRGVDGVWYFAGFR